MDVLFTNDTLTLKDRVVQVFFGEVNGEVFAEILKRKSRLNKHGATLAGKPILDIS